MAAVACATGRAASDRSVSTLSKLMEPRHPADAPPIRATDSTTRFRRTYLSAGAPRSSPDRLEDQIRPPGSLSGGFDQILQGGEVVGRTPHRWRPRPGRRRRSACSGRRPRRRSRASGSTPPVIPRALRTWAANPWMVVMVAASNSAMAVRIRARCRVTSPEARWRATTSSPTSGCPGSSRSATSISRSRTRARSSLVAARVKVTISSSEAEMSDSARYRVARSASA